MLSFFSGAVGIIEAILSGNVSRECRDWRICTWFCYAEPDSCHGRSRSVQLPAGYQGWIACLLVSPWLALALAVSGCTRVFELLGRAYLLRCDLHHLDLPHAQGSRSSTAMLRDFLAIEIVYDFYCYYYFRGAETGLLRL